MRAADATNRSGGGGAKFRPRALLALAAGWALLCAVAAATTLEPLTPERREKIEKVLDRKYYTLAEKIRKEYDDIESDLDLLTEEVKLTKYYSRGHIRLHFTGWEINALAQRIRTNARCVRALDWRTRAHKSIFERNQTFMKCHLFAALSALIEVADKLNRFLLRHEFTGADAALGTRLVQYLNEVRALSNELAKRLYRSETPDILLSYAVNFYRARYKRCAQKLLPAELCASDAPAAGATQAYIDWVRAQAPQDPHAQFRLMCTEDFYCPREDYDEIGSLLKFHLLNVEATHLIVFDFELNRLKKEMRMKSIDAVRYSIFWERRIQVFLRNNFETDPQTKRFALPCARTLAKDGMPVVRAGFAGDQHDLQFGDELIKAMKAEFNEARRITVSGKLRDAFLDSQDERPAERPTRETSGFDVLRRLRRRRVAAEDVDERDIAAIKAERRAQKMAARDRHAAKPAKTRRKSRTGRHREAERNPDWVESLSPRSGKRRSAPEKRAIDTLICYDLLKAIFGPHDALRDVMADARPRWRSEENIFLMGVPDVDSDGEQAQDQGPGAASAQNIALSNGPGSSKAQELGPGSARADQDPTESKDPVSGKGQGQGSGAGAKTKVIGPVKTGRAVHFQVGPNPDEGDDEDSGPGESAAHARRRSLHPQLAHRRKAEQQTQQQQQRKAGEALKRGNKTQKKSTAQPKTVTGAVQSHGAEPDRPLPALPAGQGPDGAIPDSIRMDWSASSRAPKRIYFYSEGKLLEYRTERVNDAELELHFRRIAKEIGTARPNPQDPSNKPKHKDQDQDHKDHPK